MGQGIAAFLDLSGNFGCGQFSAAHLSHGAVFNADSSDLLAGDLWAFSGNVPAERRRYFCLYTFLFSGLEKVWKSWEMTAETIRKKKKRTGGHCHEDRCGTGPFARVCA